MGRRGRPMGSDDGERRRTVSMTIDDSQLRWAKATAATMFAGNLSMLLRDALAEYRMNREKGGRR